MTPARALATLVAGLALAVASEAAAQEPGDAARGREVFDAKGCARCHVPRGQEGMGPPLPQLRRPQGAFALAGRLWNHVPAMFTALKIESLAWPQIAPEEMADLMRYLGADPGRDPAPDPGKGHLTLVRKGCLKCHSLRGEGGRLGPELAAARASYESAVAWTARMWAHAPAMAARAMEVGVLYPRFADDEMRHLVAFLRSTAK